MPKDPLEKMMAAGRGQGDGDEVKTERQRRICDGRPQLRFQLCAVAGTRQVFL